MKKTIVSWSGGKDSTMMLHRLLQNPEYPISGLFTSINRVARSVPFHGIGEDLLKDQAASLRLPIQFLELSPSPSNNEYEESLGEFLKNCKENEITHVAFGDIFLKDLRKYREDLVTACGLQAIFPLWGEQTESLARQFIKDGYKASICGIDKSKLPYSLLGHQYNKSFIQTIEKSADSCGENGEFHTFVYGGPIFSRELSFGTAGTENTFPGFRTLLLQREDNT
ncbi:hypothetical protein [Bacillus sp. SJS]|uniref:Dph6-related ATP pyrophosphatase n=1 Tax=Bacillus sp. SJS TaxID=1423321 RepID=UPI00068A2660|nr:hypothetical protein [Bacillus sp. SJS]KZZ82911.1 hypothetical protein AS29_019130 [Bacillus sp. SJS]